MREAVFALSTPSMREAVFALSTRAVALRGVVAGKLGLPCRFSVGRRL